ncbi:hypothetical protein GCM10023187_12910 [Nibrella viscosa]|uniref:Two component regulator propeller n=2 Tax=Nibrella viscosa TaxID=1084524 RepID=A0ABP8K4M6_9BACT
MYQDREGFMWFGTWNGLNRYDGYTFTVFKPNPKDPEHSMQGSMAVDIHEDRSGRFWVATGAGLILINKQTGEITPFGIPPIRLNFSNILCKIYEDRKGLFWLTADGAILRFNPDTKEFKKYPHSFNSWLYGILEDQKGRMWTGGVTGLYQFHPQTGAFTPIVLDSTLAKQPYVASLHLDKRGFLWVGTEGEGIFRMDTRLATPRFVRYNPNGIIHQRIRAYDQGFFEDQQGFLWVVTKEGLQRIDSRTDQVITLTTHELQARGLFSNGISCVYLDRSGTLWIGTDQGISKSLSYARKFQMRQVTPTTSSLPQNNVGTLLEDAQGTLWLGRDGKAFSQTYSTGFYRLAPASGLATPVVVAYQNKHLSPEEEISALYEDAKKQLWVGSSTGLTLIDQTRRTSTHYPFDMPVTKIVADNRGKLWLVVGEWGGYIACFDPQTGQSTAYRKEVGSSTDRKRYIGVNNSTPRDLLVSRTGDIYIGTLGAGIDRLNPQTGEFTYYTPTYPFDRRHINDRDAISLYEDADGIIWAGTVVGGLNRLDPATGEFTFYSTHNGLPSDQIVSIIGDAKGNLWLGTDQGLCRFDPRTRTARTYTIHDGLPANEFRERAVYRRGDRLLFGTANGAVIFHPDSLPDNPTPPPVYLTRFEVMGKAQPLPAGPVEFPHDRNFLAFEFVAINYHAPQKNQYAYRLEGIDKDWVYSGTRRFVSYSDLKPGTYTFRVKAANNDDIWNEKGVSQVVIIHPPWWRTWWFTTLAIATGFSLMYTGYRYRVEQIRRGEQQKAEFSKKLSEMEMQALRAQMNPHFIFNSLNSINTFILKNDPESASEYLAKFSRLIRLILQNSSQPVVTLENELEALRLYLNMESLRFRNKFTYAIEVDPEVETDVIEIPPLLIQPYIENAIWHGLMHKEGIGHVGINLHMADDMLVCIIEDDGVGRRRAAELKSKSATRSKSLGMQITAHRIKLINELHGRETTMRIVDLVDATGEACGTRVVLHIAV